MTATQEENWLTATNPRHLLRLSRVRPDGRKYLLLACAAVRSLLPGARTDLGLRVLGVLEWFALDQPARGTDTHLWREVVQPGIPELADVRRFDLLADAGWVQRFALSLGPLSQVHTTEVDRVFDLALAPARTAAAQDARREAQEIAARLLLVTHPPPAGWFARLLRQVALTDPKDRLDAAQYREEILSRLPAADRDRASEGWPVSSAGFSPWQRGLTVLTEARENQRLSELNLRTCELVREVFDNPFRPPAIHPDWLDWNHSAAQRIAEEIAATGDFSQLPILADALEEAGCTDRELLSHCREGRTHVPGCWALDAVLGR
ncbi:MAG: hypothetical protein K2V38_11270 [Gemmataceae bacterium]|nr:hypothetical protein [Gemmataceae bacterium]